MSFYSIPNLEASGATYNLEGLDEPEVPDDEEIHAIARAVSASLRPEAPYIRTIDFRTITVRGTSFTGGCLSTGNGVSWFVPTSSVVGRSWASGIRSEDFPGARRSPETTSVSGRGGGSPRGLQTMRIARQDAIELAVRAVRLHHRLQRGEQDPVFTRPCPGKHATAAEAESFLISRPWFLFRIELAEEAARYRRLSPKSNALAILARKPGHRLLEVPRGLDG
ncbi:hypothetical protein CHU98_g10371 [Xylaria longipes]|nr:hypothetical protein CHU98_g10371 [Xylaria longipes]